MDNTEMVTQNELVAKQNQSEEQARIVLTQQTRLSDLISDAAKAQGREDLPEKMKNIERSGLLSLTGGLAQIENRCNNNLFAGVRMYANGDRDIVFRQKYNDGSYSPEFSIAQDSLLLVAVYQQTGDSSIKQEATKSLQRIRKEYLRKLNNNEFLNIPEALSALAEVLKRLPIISEEYELSAIELYNEIISILGEVGFVCGSTELERLRKEKRGYLVLEEEHLSHISRELKMPQKQLLEQLKKHNLLYLTGSCKGYQCKIPYGKDLDGGIKYCWAYCLYDLEYLNEHSTGKCPPAEITPYDDV